MRFTLNGSIAAADTGKPSDGRGFYLCRSAECIETAIKRKAFNRACKRNVEEREIRELIGQALGSHQGGIDVKES